MGTHQILPLLQIQCLYRMRTMTRICNAVSREFFKTAGMYYFCCDNHFDTLFYQPISTSVVLHFNKRGF